MKLIKKRETWLIIAIIVIAAWFRFYRVRDYIVFLGDEGRDVLVVRNILMGNLTLLGPTASVGGFYLGPIYYYMMAPFLWASRFDPSGPAYLISIIGTATVYLVYLFGKKFFHSVVGLSAAFLYALAPLIVRYSRVSWNPNPLPFFTLLGIYLLSIGIKQKKKLLVYLAGACLGIAWQLHYLSLILTGVYGVMLLDVLPRKTWLNLKFSSQKLKQIATRSLLVATGWATTFAPFLAFEIRHRFPNTQTIIEFVTRPRGAIDTKPIDIITSFYSRLTRLFFEAYSVPNSSLVVFIAIVATLALIHASRKRNKALLIWFFVGLAGMAVYQGDIHNYYFGFLFPVPFLLTGIMVYLLWLRGWLGKLIALIGLTILAGNFIQKAFFQIEPNRLISQTQTIANMVVDFAEGKPYNFALIAPGNSDHAYRYFLQISDNQPLKLEEEVTQQLIIVCELPQEKCQPLGHPLWEIAGFGRKEIIGVKRAPVSDISLFKMIHHQSSLELIGKPAKKG